MAERSPSPHPLGGPSPEELTSPAEYTPPQGQPVPTGQPPYLERLPTPNPLAGRIPQGFKTGNTIHLDGNGDVNTAYAASLPTLAVPEEFTGVAGMGPVGPIANRVLPESARVKVNRPYIDGYPIYKPGERLQKTRDKLFGKPDDGLLPRFATAAGDKAADIMDDKSKSRATRILGGSALALAAVVPMVPGMLTVPFRAIGRRRKES